MVVDKQVKRWIRRIRQSADKKSANALISHYFDEIYGFVFKRVSDEEVAMDVTQEIFVNVLQSIDNYDKEKSSFRTWLYQIAKRRIVDYYRSKDYQEDRLVDIDEGFDDLLGDFEDAQSVAELAEISEFVDGLDCESREIFKLKIFEGHTFSGISQIVNMPESTVKASFYATRKLIREDYQ